MKEWLAIIGAGLAACFLWAAALFTLLFIAAIPTLCLAGFVWLIIWTLKHFGIL